jgi:hypothetical protein
MTHEQLFNLIHMRPFRPVRLKTAGGRELTVTHPENIAYAGERTVALVLPGDRWEILDINLIESIEGANEPAPAESGDEAE